MRTVQVDGKDRRFLVSVPQVSKEEEMPVLFVLHGGGGSARGTSRLGFSRLSEERGFLVVYPDGIESHWNDGRVDQVVEWPDGRPDDVKFIATLLATLEKEYPVDKKRVYATGLSNGAMMSHRLAMEMSDRFAAIAPVIGSIPAVRAREFRPTHPVSVLIIQGTADPWMPYDGGQITAGGTTRGAVLSTDEVVETWVLHNKCKDPVMDTLEDKADDGCRVERTRYSGGAEDTEVVLYKVIGGGHTMPGGDQYLPKRVIGPVCHDFDGIDVIGEFLSRHDRP
jgi:polyhydroxybutyrate depolymerase